MNTLFVKNLVIRGRHGQTGRERVEDQVFEVDLKISLDTCIPAKTDCLADAYDYKQAVSIAQAVITGTESCLLERLADRIASHIVNDHKVDEVEVIIRKPRSGGDGMPGIKVKKKRALHRLPVGFLPFDFSKILREIRMHGATSFPLLEDYYRLMLLHEAEKLKYVTQPEFVGPAKVREQLSSVEKIPEPSIFTALKKEFETLIACSIMNLERGERPFEIPFYFNEMSLQKYEVGSIGITPHLDSARCQNLIVIFVLKGEAKFATCKDRSGAGAYNVHPKPGNVILMRAGGFDKSDYRPFHFLSDVTEERIAFGLRDFRKS